MAASNCTFTLGTTCAGVALDAEFSSLVPFWIDASDAAPRPSRSRRRTETLNSFQTAKTKNRKTMNDTLELISTASTAAAGPGPGPLADLETFALAGNAR